MSPSVYCRANLVCYHQKVEGWGGPMAHRMAVVAVFVGGVFLVASGRVAAQGPPGRPVNGSGTPGTIPVLTGSGGTLKDSHIEDDGTVISVSEPLHVSAPLRANDGGSIGLGVEGATNSAGGTGVLGVNADGFGVSGWSFGTGVFSGGVGATGRIYGVVARSADCSMDFQTCTPGSGTAGFFFTGAGGNIIQGMRWDAPPNAPQTFTPVFTVDPAGNLTIAANAFKPSGGSWSTLSDRRVKKSIEPVAGALNQLLKLRGVTYEYANPSAVGELPGVHLGMVAQEVEQVFPSWVDTGADGYKRLTFRGFEAITVEAVRE